ncbi:MAG: universal stress protein [Flavobacteriaceae bacterium]|nr:universal stress protein [Flavobacteriaceae bacterium]
MKNILLPTDFSDNSWHAIQYALQLFAKESCTFYVLNSFEQTMSPPTSGISSKMAQKAIHKAQEENSESDLRDILNRIKQYSEKPHHDFKMISMYNVFTDAVEQCLEKYNIDMVVMGTTGSNAVKDMTVGSNTASLVGRVACPLIAVPKDTVYKKYTEIGLATDYEVKFTEQLLKPLTDLLERAKATLSVFHILVDHESLSDEQVGLKDELEQIVSKTPINFYLLTETKVGSGIQMFIESRELDMLCIIAKKHNFIERLFDRTYSKNISKHMHIPLLVLNANFKK